LAKERKASVIYEGNASQLVYAFPFDYLRKKFVKVEDIYTNITELTIGVDYTVEDKQVRLVKGIPLGHSVKIYRETTTAPLVEWQDASVLRSADLSLQEVQLLHLAEETGDRVFDSGMSTAYDNPNCWDGQYKRIINALDPIEDGDVVTLRYIKANQDSLLNQLKNTGATQNKRITDTGNAYVSTMTTLKDTATTKANDASNSAELSKKWAMSSSSPDGVSGNKSSKTWAEEAKTSESNSAASASASKQSATASASSATNAANSANASKQSASASANSASASTSSATNAANSAADAKISATNAKMSETNAANSAKAAKQSEENAKKWDLTQLPSVIDMFYPVGTIYETTSSVKPEFMNYGTWEQLPGGYTTVSAGTYSETHNFSDLGIMRTDNYVFTAGKTTYTVNGVETSGEAKHRITQNELPARTVIFMRNANNVNIAGYAIVNAGNATVAPNEWGLCNLLDAPTYSLGAYDAQVMNITNPIYCVYRYRRIR
jgi:hypothetical protein